MNSYVALLRRNRNYRLVWLGAVASYLGDWFNLIASAELITRLTDSGAAISYLFLARFLPSFVLSPLAGVLADRYDRRLLMVTSDVLRALIVLGFLLIDRPEQVWVLYLLTVLQFSLSTLFVPAKSAVIATVVDPADLLAANTLDSFTWSAMLAIGSLLGGLATGMFGGDVAFVLDAATFVVSAVLIARVASAPATAPTAETAEGAWAHWAGGFTYLWAVPALFVISLVKAGGSLVWGAINVLEIQYAARVFPIGEQGATMLGLIYAVSGLGTGLGPIVMRRWLGDETAQLKWGISLGFGGLAAGIGLLGVAPTAGLFLAGTFVRTLGSGTLWVFSTVLLQREVADHVRGRVFAFEFAVLTLTQSLSILWAGWGQDALALSLRAVTLITSGAGVLVWLLWTAGRRIGRRRSAVE